MASSRRWLRLEPPCQAAKHSVTREGIREPATAAAGFTPSRRSATDVGFDMHIRNPIRWFSLCVVVAIVASFSLTSYVTAASPDPSTSSRANGISSQSVSQTSRATAQVPDSFQGPKRQSQHEHDEATDTDITALVMRITVCSVSLWASVALVMICWRGVRFVVRAAPGDTSV